MFKLVLLTLLIRVFATAGKPFIIGGSEASDGAFPYQVSLRLRNNKLVCGGSIIGSRHVLTAGHCLYNRSPADVIVVTGTNSLSTGGDVYEISTWKIHPDYVHYDVNDIGFITLQDEIVFETNRVEKIPLNMLLIGDGEDVILSGWGASRFPGIEFPDRLQFIHLRTISNEDCKKRWESMEGSIEEGNICTLTKEGEEGCEGDSGGPLVYNYQLAGIVSWGSPCAKGYPDVYTRVSIYTKWITEQFN